MLSTLILVVPATLASPATRPPPSPRAWEAALTADFGAYSAQTSAYSPSAWSTALTLRLHWRAGFEALMGVRVLVGHQLPTGARSEHYVGAAVMPAFGAWRPSVGIEFGYTGVTRLEISEQTAAPGHDRRIRTDMSPLYGAMTADPLRFRVGPIGFSFAQIHLGTDLLRAGRVLRVLVNFARVEVYF